MCRVIFKDYYPPITHQITIAHAQIHAVVPVILAQLAQFHTLDLQALMARLALPPLRVHVQLAVLAIELVLAQGLAVVKALRVQFDLLVMLAASAQC